MTETSPVLSMASRTLEDYNSVGFPLPNTDFMIVNEALKPVGPNEVSVTNKLNTHCLQNSVERG